MPHPKPDVKKISMDIGEDLAKRVVTDLVKPFAAHYIEQSENKIDDILLPFLDQLEDALVNLLDKIDGEEDEA